MAGKNKETMPNEPKAGAGNPAADSPISEKNIDAVEDQTISKASEAIRVLEDALSKWDALSVKPEEHQEGFEKLRKFHEELVEWERGILKSRAKGEELDFYSRVDRLLVFARICQAHR